MSGDREGTVAGGRESGVRRERTEDGGRKAGKGKESISEGMTPFRRDDSLREWDGIPAESGMIPAGLDGKGKTEVGGQMSEVRKQEKGFGDLRFHSTFDIIEGVEEGVFPERVMMTFHPQRWTDNPVEWTKELVWQNVKNVIKKRMISRPG